MKYKPERDLVEFAREAKTLSPSKLAEIVLNRRNKEISPESITMWFNRHPQVHDDLSKELVQGLPTEKQAVDDSIFQNGNFQEIPSVKNWIVEMNARELDPKTIEGQLINLKSSCLGKFRQRQSDVPKIDFVVEGKWAMKHPDRISLNDALELITLLKERNIDTHQYKRALKDFLISKGVVVGKKIAVGKSKGYGKYAKLNIEKPKILLMLKELLATNFEAFTADLFMLKTGTRVNATLNALIEDIQDKLTHGTIMIFDKGRRSKYSKGHPWEKQLDAQLYDAIKKLIGERKNGKIFTITETPLAEINRAIITKYAPEVPERYPDFMPNHIWRHLFAQLLLPQENWNYAKVAALGGWTPQALEESYGKPPDELVREWGKECSVVIDGLEVQA
jgi:integrase